jgi:flagellin
MITSRRADLGAVSNRLDHTMSNLSTSRVNMEASQSRIEDADFAVETSNLTKAQILSQAATAMLAQANASKQSVLSLLQG